MSDLIEPFNKSELSEKEVHLLMKRINDGRIKPSELPHFTDGEGYGLSDAQVKKGLDWLRNLWKSPRGVERKNNPFGAREQAILDDKGASIRLRDVYSERGNYYYPYYEVTGDNTSFGYYVSGGEVHILG